MSECPVCFTPVTDQLYFAEWDELPRSVIYSCSYGCTQWERPIEDEELEEWIYYMSGAAYRMRVAGWASGEDQNGRFFVVFARVPDWVIRDGEESDPDEAITRRYKNVSAASRARFRAAVRRRVLKGVRPSE